MVFVELAAVLVLAALVMMVFLLLYEMIICPVRPGENERIETALRVKGSAPGLENTLRGLLWLKSSGRVDMSIVLVDEGMDPDSRHTAQLLCEKNGIDFLQNDLVR